MCRIHKLQLEQKLQNFSAYFSMDIRMHVLQASGNANVILQM